MIIKRISSAVLSFSLLTQSVAPALCMEEIENSNLPYLSKNPKSPLSIKSQEKTAAGVLHYAEHKDGTYILLGRRDDSQDKDRGDWCNFGGKSEGMEKIEGDISLTLNHDAARECREESNDLYAPHPRALKNQPFIDVITDSKKGGSLLYRMYWQKVQHISEEIFIDKINHAQKEHSKEYTDFCWVNVSDLLKAVEFGCPVVAVDKKEITIYQPLFQTLSTLSGKAFLKHLLKHSDLKTYWSKSLLSYSSVRSYFNRCYDLRSTDFGDLDLSPLRPLSREILSLAVAAHGMAMIELKQRFHVPSMPEAVHTIPSWNPHSSDCLSRIHLKMVLGKAYKNADDPKFKNQEKPQRCADLANIKEYFRLYTQVEYEQKNNKEEFKRKIDLLESDYELLADILNHEGEHKNWPTFYHAATENVHNLYKSFTYIRELLSLTPFIDFLALRGTDIYFKDILLTPEDLDIVTQYAKKEAYSETTATKNAMMFLNFVLFAGRQTTVTTSSSVEYLINNHSVDEPNIEERFEEALALAGFSNPDYKPFQSIFDQFYRYQKRPFGNSVMLAISQNPTVLNNHNYPTSGGGHLYKVPSTLDVLKNIQTEDQRLEELFQKTGEREPFSVDQEKKSPLFPENRLLLHPIHVMNPQQIKMKLFPRFKINLENEKVYDQEMRVLTISFLADWLSQHSIVLKDSYLSYPPLKRIYNEVYKKCEEEALKETFSPKGFIYLIRNGHLEGTQSFINLFPEITKEGDISKVDLAQAALDSDQSNVLDFILGKFCNGTLNGVLSQKVFLSIAQNLLYNENKDAFFRLLSHYDLQNIRGTIKRYWVRQLAPHHYCQIVHSLEDTLNQIHKLMPEHVYSFVENLFASFNPHFITHENVVGSQEQILSILEKDFINPQICLTLLFEKLRKGFFDSAAYFNVLFFLSHLIKKGADITQLHQLTQESMAFELFKNVDYDFYNFDIFECFDNLKDITQIKNKNGLTLLQFLEKEYLETKKRNGMLDKMLSSKYKNIFTEHYQPFVDYFGNFCGYSLKTITKKESIKWGDDLQKINNLTNLELHLENCPAPNRLIEIFSHKINILSKKYSEKTIYRGYFFYMNKAEEKKKIWFKEVTEFISIGKTDLETMKKFLDQAPCIECIQDIFGNCIEDCYSPLLPGLLKQLYAKPEDLISEVYTQIQNLNDYKYYDSSLHKALSDGRKLCADPILDFIGYDHLKLFAQKYGKWHETPYLLQPVHLDKWFAADPECFLECHKNKPVDLFSYLLESFPLKLKGEILIKHIKKLKRHDKLGNPYFWVLLGSEENKLIVRILTKIDPTLWKLKSHTGINLNWLIKKIPAGFKEFFHLIPKDDEEKK